MIVFWICLDETVRKLIFEIALLCVYQRYIWKYLYLILDRSKVWLTTCASNEYRRFEFTINVRVSALAEMHTWSKFITIELALYLARLRALLTYYVFMGP